ncbi:MAG: APC family permease [Firmicutes bacterium]|nr:APC family permease [Bacillota bacterium]
MEDNRVELKKTLNPATVWALALGSIIGWGAFVLPGNFLAKSGPLGSSLGFLIGAVFMMVIASSYGYMVKNFPVAGGEFAYAYKAFGRHHAYICGWFLTLGYLSIVALNGTALAVLGKFVLPGVFARGYMYSIAGWEVYLGEVLLSCIAIILFGVFNYRGVKIMGRAQLLIVSLLCGGVVLIGFGTFLDPGAAISNLKPAFAPDKTMFASIAAVLAIAPFLYVGFDTIPQSAEEFDFPHDKSFKLMFWAILIGALMYTVVTVGTAIASPWQQLLATEPTWATGQSMQETLGNWGLMFLSLSLLMGICSGINGFFMATSRLLFSMGRARVIPKFFTDIHPKYQTPYKAVIFTLILSITAPWFGRQVVIWIVDMAAVGTAIGYLYTCLSAYLGFKYSPDLEGASKGKSVALLGTFFSLVILGLLIIPGSPAFLTPPSWIALASWIAIGVFFYMTMVKEYLQIPKATLDHLVFGDSKVEDVIEKSA